jgi:hypothetical protein
MDEILKVKGGNEYDLPHLGKGAMGQHVGSIPDQIIVSAEALASAELVRQI